MRLFPHLRQKREWAERRLIKMKDRIILHCDGNSFFASVESVLRPELKSVPMAVVGNPENRHGIVLAKNELAKQYGIQTAETIWSAKKKCPDLVCVAPHHELYHAFFEKLNRIYLDYTDLVEPFSIDESFLDVTGTLHLFSATPKELADRIRARVREELGITISVGVSFCKVFAKLGSDYKKPDATTVIFREDVEKIVYPLPVSDLLFIGKKSVEILHRYAIHTCEDVSRLDRSFLVHILGKQGNMLYDYIHGLDQDPVHDFYEKREVKSVGNSITFRQDLIGEAQIRAGINEIADSVTSRLRHQESKAYTVQIAVKDPDFKTMQRQRKLAHPTFLQKDFSKVAMELIRENWDFSKPVRLLSVTGTDLVPADAPVPEQLSLFEEKSESQGEKERQRERLENTMDSIRDRFGKDKIGFAWTSEEKGRK